MLPRLVAGAARLIVPVVLVSSLWAGTAWSQVAPDSSSRPATGRAPGSNRAPSVEPSGQPRVLPATPSVGLPVGPVYPGYQGAGRDTLGNSVPSAALSPIEAINVREADLRDLLRSIGEQAGLNLVVDSQINRQVTVRLSDLSTLDALRFLAQEYGLLLERSGAVYRIRQPEAPAPVRRVPTIHVADNRLSVDLTGDDLRESMRLITEQSGRNIVLRQGVSGSLTGYLQDLPLEVGLRTLLANNGFMLRQQDSIYVVDRSYSGGREGSGSSPAPGMTGAAPGYPGGGAPGPTPGGYTGGGGGLFVNVHAGVIDLDVQNADVLAVLREIAQQMGLDLVTYGQPEGRFTGRLGGLSLEQALGYLFKGTNVTYRIEGNVVVVGDKKVSGIASSKLIRLRHIKVEGLIEMIPEAIRRDATLQIIKEQNGVVVMATSDVIAQLEEFIRQIDNPTPQILIEALVVDYQTTDVLDLGVAFGSTGLGNAGAQGYSFGGSDGQSGGYTYNASGERINRIRDQAERQLRGSKAEQMTQLLGDLLGIRKIGYLPDDFYLRIQALAREGRANVRSRPQIATLNGHPASISIGTTQYYILRSNAAVPSTGSYVPIETERFEKIEANVRLDITPWVSASGEVTTEIKPEFSTPVGGFSQGVPPTINNRVLNSTVRLKDGETIILGGLIQDGETVTANKVPLLGDIPFIGRLFRSRSQNKNKSVLVIYLTPHIFYGDEQDALRWHELDNDLRQDGTPAGIYTRVAPWGDERDPLRPKFGGSGADSLRFIPDFTPGYAPVEPAMRSKPAQPTSAPEGAERDQPMQPSPAESQQPEDAAPASAAPDATGGGEPSRP